MKTPPTSSFERRTHLRSRVLLLTGSFAIALFAITFTLSWRAKEAEERWARLVGVENEAIARLEEVVRAQNAFHAQVRAGDVNAVDHYRVVEQLLNDAALAPAETHALREAMNEFQQTFDDQGSAHVVAVAHAMVEEHKRAIASQLPALKRGSTDMMSSGLAIAWIIVISSFAAVQLTLRKVVKPLEELAAAADRIAGGDLSARAAPGGDYEIVKLGIAFNRMADELKARARTDELTGLPNFRAFRERIDAEVERAGRYEEQFGFLILDLDKFKVYNDTHGHHAGNNALRRVAQVIREFVRTVDFPARYGGEEFAVVVPQTDGPSLLGIAERIRSGVEQLQAPPDGSKVTVSIGAAMYPRDGTTADALFVAADERLYAAKSAGRNRVVAPPDILTRPASA